MSPSGAGNLRSRAQRRATPKPHSHPDNVVIDPERGVRFVGPTDERQAVQLEEALKVRDILLMQDALDQRLSGDLDGDGLASRPGTALLLSLKLIDTAPDRFKLRDTVITIRMMRYAATPKRQLLKVLYRGWRALGADFPRGKVFPPLRVGEAWMGFFAALQQGLREHHYLILDERYHPRFPKQTRHDWNPYMNIVLTNIASA